MSKYNAKKTPVMPTEVNRMGEKAFKLSDKEELVSTVMTTFLTDAYYEKESEVTKRIMTLLDNVDPLFAAKLSLYARDDGKLRSVTHLLAAYVAHMISGAEWGSRYYNKIVFRPDDMSEILGCYAKLNGFDVNKLSKIPNAIKRGFKQALERLDAYQIDKYKMNTRSISMIDLVNLFHPKGTQKNQEAYRRLMNGESLAGLYDSKILEKTMTAAGEKTKNASQKEKDAAKQEAIKEVLSNVKGMPYMNLIRNLNNILLYAPNQVDEACRQLVIKEKVLNSRLLPFRFATAYAEVEKLSYNAKAPKTSIVFEDDLSSSTVSETQFIALKQKVLNALETALQIACLNIPKLDGNVAILVDHSGSVRGDAGGHSRVSAFSKTTRAMIGNLFASMVAYRQDNVYVGLFGDRLINVPIDRSKKLLDFNRESYDLGAKCGPSTETGIYEFLRKVIKEKKKIDNVIVFSDCQIGSTTTKGYCKYGSDFTAWYGTSYTDRSGEFQRLFKEFRKINPNANFIVCNINQTDGTSVFDRSQRILNIAGWSENIFSLINSQCKGWDAIIKEIEKIEI